MSEQDQILLFKKALESTGFAKEVEVDPSTHKAFNSLTAVMDRCRTIFLGRYPQDGHRTDYDSMNSKRTVHHSTDPKLLGCFKG